MNTTTTKKMSATNRFAPVRRIEPKFEPEVSPGIAPAYRVAERDGFSLSMGALPTREDERPPEEIERGACPDCAGQLVANLYWHEKRGFLLRYECWEGLLPNGVCRYYTVP